MSTDNGFNNKIRCFLRITSLDKKVITLVAEESSTYFSNFKILPQITLENNDEILLLERVISYIHDIGINDIDIELSFSNEISSIPFIYDDYSNILLSIVLSKNSNDLMLLPLFSWIEYEFNFMNEDSNDLVHPLVYTTDTSSYLYNNISNNLITINHNIKIIPLKTQTLPPATHTNCYIFGKEKLVVIDPGSIDEIENNKLIQFLESKLKQNIVIESILLTHHHMDHISGASIIQKKFDIPIRSHYKTKEYIKHVIEDLVWGEDLEDNQILEIGNSSLRVHYTPGHAFGHLCFEDIESSFYIVGDMIASIGSISITPPDGDMSLYFDSLAYLKKAKPKCLLPAHGSPVGGVDFKLDEFINHRKFREHQIITAIKEGHSLIESMVSVIYCDIPLELIPIAEQTLIAHLEKLEKDGIITNNNSFYSIL